MERVERSPLESSLPENPPKEKKRKNPLLGKFPPGKFPFEKSPSPPPMKSSTRTDIFY